MTRYPEQVVQLIKMLESMRERPGMYICEASVEAAEPYIAGWRLALNPRLGEGLRKKDEVWLERGWPKTTMPRAQLMLDRGMTPAQAIDEMLVIEIETLRRILGD